MQLAEVSELEFESALAEARIAQPRRMLDERKPAAGAPSQDAPAANASTKTDVAQRRVPRASPRRWRLGAVSTSKALDPWVLLAIQDSHRRDEAFAGESKRYRNAFTCQELATWGRFWVGLGKMITLADIPCAAQLIRESRDADPLYREPSGDRKMLNANDWYGIGFLFHLTGQGHTAAMRRRVYCGGTAAYEQAGAALHRFDPGAQYRRCFL
jgi:hypothetical protein